MLPFDNTTVTVPNLSRAQFKELLEHGFATVAPAASNGRFPQVAGFKVVYDGREQAQVTDAAGVVTTPGQRVRTVTLINPDGSPGAAIVTAGAVVPGAALTLVTNNFTAAGGDGYPFRGIPTQTLQPSVGYQQALFDFITTPAADGGLEGTIAARTTRAAPSTGSPTSTRPIPPTRRAADLTAGGAAGRADARRGPAAPASARGRAGRGRRAPSPARCRW